MKRANRGAESNSDLEQKMDDLLLAQAARVPGLEGEIEHLRRDLDTAQRMLIDGQLQWEEERRRARQAERDRDEALRDARALRGRLEGRAPLHALRIGGNPDMHQRVWFAVVAGVQGGWSVFEIADSVKRIVDDEIRSVRTCPGIDQSERGAGCQDCGTPYTEMHRGESCPEPASAAQPAPQWSCDHSPEKRHPGPKIALRHGHAATEVCACGAWSDARGDARQWRRDPFCAADGEEGTLCGTRGWATTDRAGVTCPECGTRLGDTLHQESGDAG